MPLDGSRSGWAHGPLRALTCRPISGAVGQERPVGYTARRSLNLTFGDSMETVYDLRTDTENIGHMQRGSLSPGPTGLAITHGLIGSPDWWAHIRAGTLHLRKVEGTVSGYWPGQWAAGPAEFEVRDQNGNASRWLCWLEPQLAGSVFRIGRAVQVQYVEQLLKTAFEGTRASKITVSIAVGTAP
jgi:hypothetical protein